MKQLKSCNPFSDVDSAVHESTFSIGKTDAIVMQI